jgi:hypothetical protein
VSQPSRPKNFDQILDTVKQIVTYLRESDEKAWSEKYEELWNQKFDELASLVFLDKRLQKDLSVEDLRDRLLNIVMHLNKDIIDITDDDLEKYLDKLLREPEKYEFFFPAMELFNYPEGYQVGLCDLHSFEQLPPQAQTRISSRWKSTYEREKVIYYARSLQEYEDLKRKETYFCLTLEALGNYTAIEAATRGANQALNILKCFYHLEHQPKLKACYYLSSGWAGGVSEERFKWGWHKHWEFPEIEQYVRTITGFARNAANDEIARRCLSAIDMYGLIEYETPLELKFLLSVMATESLLLGKNDEDFLGWKLREKVAILLGDTPGWYRQFLQKQSPTQEECEGSRVAARAELAKKVGEMYDKRSALVHRYEEENKITEKDFDFASMVMRFSLHRVLRLYNEQGIRRVPKASTVDAQSLDGYIESMKYSVPFGW